MLALCNAYVEALRAEGKPVKNCESRIRLYIESSPLAQVPAEHVTSRQITDLLCPIVDSHKGRTAAHVRSILHAAYGRALKAPTNPQARSQFRDFNLCTNPVSAVDALSEFKSARERALANVELARLWGKLNPPFEASIQYRAVRLSLLLGGQRCEQLVRAPLGSVDLDAGTLALLDKKGRRKKPRDHVLPLVSAAKADVLWLMQNSRDVGSSFLFAGRFRSEHLSSSTVCDAVEAISKQLQKDNTVTEPFSYGDLRRTCETRMAALRVLPHIRAQLQSHDLGGVQLRHYDKWQYMDEKREALEVWERHLQSLLKSGSTSPSQPRIQSVR